MKKNKSRIDIYKYLLIILIPIGIYSIYTNFKDDPTKFDLKIEPIGRANLPGIDPLNATYNIDGDSITLVDGKKEMNLPEYQQKVRFYNQSIPASGNLKKNNYENNDYAFILVKDPAGEERFYYLVASLNKEDKFFGTNGVLIGDRIKIEELIINDDRTISLKFLTRSENEPMSQAPSIAEGGIYSIEGNYLVELPRLTTER